MTDRSSASIRQQLCESALGDIDKIFKTDNKVWNEDPISFRDFVISKEHMNFVPLSERQEAPFDFLFGNDPKKIFDNGNTTAVLCWGKGCVSAETVLEDALTHEKYTVGDLYKNQKSIFVNCYDENTKRSTIEVASVPWISGNGEIYKVETESGKTINVYKFHKFLTRNGWKRLSELSVGDEILDDNIDLETSNIISNVINEFKETHKTYTEVEVKTYLLERFSWKKKSKEEKLRNKLIYYKSLYGIMGEDWRSKKFGSQKEKHPLWGTHQSEESKKRNSEHNKITLRKIYESERGEEIKQKISLKMKGNKNPMYGKAAPFGSGKCDYFKFKNNKGEEFYIQGTWELKFAEFLNDKNINWEKNFDRFNYIAKDGSERTYCPDFKLFFEHKSIYVEIKGLEDENVNIKLQAVRDAGKEIIIIRQDTFRQYYKNYETPELKFEKIKAITYLRNDNYYDLEVDKYHNYLAHGLYNHNSGKDTITSLLMCYTVYVLLCLRSPQKFLNLPEGEAIDLLNVAVNAQQASGVFFEKFKQRLIRWQWLRDKYPVKFSGSFLGQARIDDILNTVTITQNAAIFPNNIRAISGHSGANSQEGKNILFFVCDEIAGFDETPATNKGITIFNMMKSSAISRFGNRYKGVALSFSRYEGDAILRLYDQGQSELHWFCDKACTWEVKPAHCFKDYPQKYFEFQGHKIPLEYQSEFKADPENAKTKYMCLPSSISSVFIEKPEKIRACIDPNRLPLVDTQDYEEDGYVKKLITNYNISRTDIDYTITIDLGLRSDSAALSIFHTESTATGLKAIQDLMISWVPNPEKKLEVSMHNVKQFLVDISKHININRVYFDQWNSALLIEQLNELHIPSEEYRLNFADYKHAKEMMYEGRVSLQPSERLQEEFRRLILTRSKRVDHPADFHNDNCDTVVGAIKILLTKKALNNNINMEGGIYIQDNLSSIGGTIIGQQR